MSDSQQSVVPLFRFVSKRVAEYFKEAAVLINVFAFLDKIVVGDEVRALYVIGVMATSILFLGFGIVLERRFGG